jgi:hypothetical protein
MLQPPAREACEQTNWQRYMHSDGSIECCAVTNDGKTIVAGDAAGQVHILRWEEPSGATSAR